MRKGVFDRQWWEAGLGSLVLLVSVGFASDALGTKYAGEFLAVGVSARAMGMGGAFVAVADDASAAYWNPAGLAFIQTRTVLPEHSENFGGVVNYDDLAYVHPQTGGEHASAFGIMVLRLAVQDIPDTRDLPYCDSTWCGGNENGQYDPGERVWFDPSRIHWRTDSEVAVFLSYGRELRPGLAVGGTLKPIRKSFAEYSCFGFGADLGFLMRSENGVSVGISLQDFFGTILSWDTGTRETITPNAHLGVAYQRGFESIETHLLLAVQTDIRFEGREFATQFNTGAASADFRAGMECTWRNLLALRLGTAEGNFTAGASLGMRGYWVDYAFLGHEYLDSSHRVSVRAHF
ncbi:MAG: PorV/PorQ family protein [Candidatus Eisenbacteria sp.]|nr:PorV/PorQ family protein [Candidatus Eisenbacteria bacterium]